MTSTPYCHLRKFIRFGGLMKYIDWLIQWLENYVRPSVKVRTYERYKLIIEQHIKDKIGGMELNDLSPLVLQSFITELLQSGNRKTGKGLSANSVNAIISVIQSSLKTAHLLGLTKEYMADKLKRPKLKEKPVECFTLAEQKQIEQAILNGKKDKLYGILGILAVDTYGNYLDITLTSPEESFEPGSMVKYNAYVTDAAGNVVNKEITVYIYGTPDISYNRTDITILNHTNN